METKGKDRNSAAVLVVGAGPTGLLLTSELQRRGVPCHLIDSRPAPMHWDRATVVHPRSLQIFESLGLAKKFLDAGCRQRAVKILMGRPSATVEPGFDSRLSRNAAPHRSAGLKRRDSRRNIPLR